MRNRSGNKKSGSKILVGFVLLVLLVGRITSYNVCYTKLLRVDAISSGSVIHQANWIDLSMKVES